MSKMLKYLYIKCIKPTLPHFILETIQRSLPNNKRIYHLFGYYRGSNNPQRARKLFSSGSYNIGIRTGRASKLLVVDIDLRSAIQPFIKKYNVPATLTAKTPRGAHFYFRYPESYRVLSSVKRIANIDVLAENAYVVAPPSLYVDGQQIYQWVDESAHIADIPQAFLEEAVKAGNPKQDQNCLYNSVCDNIFSPLLKCIFWI